MCERFLLQRRQKTYVTILKVLSVARAPHLGPNEMFGQIGETFTVNILFKISLLAFSFGILRQFVANQMTK